MWYIVAFIFFILSAVQAQVPEKQAYYLVQENLVRLACLEEHPQLYDADFKKFMQQAVRMVMRKKGRYPSFWSMSKIYTQEELLEGTVGQLLAYIEEKAKMYAQEAYNNISSSRTSHAAIVQSVVKQLRNELLSVTAQKQLDQLQFVPYLGNALKNKMRELVENEFTIIALRAEKKPTTISISCPVCLDNFTLNGVKKITLACSHVICRSCLQEWLRSQGPASHCPTCRCSFIVTDYIK